MTNGSRGRQESSHFMKNEGLHSLCRNFPVLALIMYNPDGYNESLSEKIPQSREKDEILEGIPIFPMAQIESTE